MLTIVEPSTVASKERYFCGNKKLIFGLSQSIKPGVLTLPVIPAGLKIESVSKPACIVPYSHNPLTWEYQPPPAAVLVIELQVYLISEPTEVRSA
jgi:hypothetical protein